MHSLGCLLDFPHQADAGFGTICTALVLGGVFAAFLFTVLTDRGTRVGERLRVCRITCAQLSQGIARRDGLLYRDRAARERRIAALEDVDAVIETSVPLGHAGLGGRHEAAVLPGMVMGRREGAPGAGHERRRAHRRGAGEEFPARGLTGASPASGWVFECNSDISALLSMWMDKGSAGV